MIKNLFLRLCLMMAVVLSTYSCRQDILQEQETYNNSSAFQLTSKRISLNEAKHKAKLLPELKQVETGFIAQSKSNLQGKTVDYGNGVSIDTDEVIYIENGTGFHSYTFNIKHENTPTDALVENLVLSSLPDGTYKELLVTYNFTSAEKQTLMNGGYVDTNGKTTVTELAAGTYSGMLSGKNSCNYETVDMVFSCYTGDHHAGNESSWGGCNWESTEGGYPPLHLTMVALVCGADTSLGDDGTPGGGVSIGEIGGLDSGNNQTATMPNLPTIKATSCQRLQALITNGIFKGNEKILFGNINFDSETGFTMGTPIPGQSTPPNQYLESPQGSNQVKFTFFYNIYAFMHTHFDGIYPIFSPGDIMEFNRWIIWAKAWNAHPANADKQINIRNLTYTVVTKYGNYTLMFDGTDVEPFPDYTKAEMIALDNIYKIELDKANNPNPPNNDFETLFLKFLKKNMNIETHIPGLKVYRLDKEDHTATEIKLNGNFKQTIQCP